MKPLMKSIDTPDQVFHDGDPSTGELGTICSAEWLNDTQASIRDIQAECIAILRANGFEPDETKRDQLWEAIQAAIKNHVPAASLVGAGIVQLSSSVTSDSETIAATLKAVKIAMDNANARLAKERNLADLTNVPLARQSLQLGNSATRDVGTTTGTVAAGDDARITGAMQRDRNGSDIPDKAAFCRALGLGALATSDGIDALIKSQNGADIPDKALFVQNLGLTEAVKRALNAVQKNGDEMTGNLTLRGDDRMHFIIINADGSVRAYIYKDKGGDGIRINNGADGGGDFILRKDGGLTLGSGAQIAPNGDILGGVWGSGWLSAAIAIRDNNINGRATIDWVNQNFITRVKRGEPVNPGKVNEYGPAEAPAGCVVTSVRHDPTTAYGIYFTYRPLSIFINGGWRVIEG
ncbi:tail fiber protein [Salmonella enterica]|nr:tail fiber protein [Salmonella enterica]EKC6123326.1 tail fiber protein [Salmonella enterica]EKC7540294.1 tail fiber protein [Salmonella enterica]EKC7549413.1 tail fiber protein [Salmonella enterica]